MNRKTCSNTTPIEGYSAANLKSVCPSCGEFLKVLPSGEFRVHKIIENLSEEAIARKVARMKAGQIVRGEGHTGPDPR